MTSCCYGFWCCPCLACTVAGQMGDHRCVPLCDMFSTAVISAIGIPVVVSPAALTIRVGIRYKYGIKSSICKDIVTSCFCVWCSWCQMPRELKIRKKCHQHAAGASYIHQAKMRVCYGLMLGLFFIGVLLKAFD